MCENASDSAGCLRKMNKNSVMEEERGRLSHPAANGEMLSAGNHQYGLCLLLERDNWMFFAVLYCVIPQAA